MTISVSVATSRDGSHFNLRHPSRPPHRLPPPSSGFLAPPLKAPVHLRALRANPLPSSIAPPPKRLSRANVSSSEGYYSSTGGESPAKALRRILELPGVHQGPACFDALSAKLIERAGFDYCFTSGKVVSTS